MKSVPIEAFNVVPYLDQSALNGRVVHLMPYWDGKEWHMWVEMGDKLQKMQMIDFAHGQYVAKTAKDNHDLCIPFIEIMWQCGTFHNNQKQLSRIAHSYHSLGASLGKIRHFHKHRDTLGMKASTYVDIEIEHMVMNCRRIFDLLQESFSELWNTSVQLLDSEHEKIRKATTLPPKFSKMIMRDSKPVDKSYLFSKYALPESIGEVYEKYTDFFHHVRNYREKVIHGFGSQDHIFDTEKGFCLAKDALLYRELKLWENLEGYNENLVSLKPYLAYLIWNTVSACNGLAEKFSGVIRLQPALAPNQHIFFRGPHNDEFIDVMNCVKEKKIWWN
jgi:hypothetical protein